MAGQILGQSSEVCGQGSATGAHVVLDFDVTNLHLVIADKGVGFDPTAPRPSGKFGMSSMLERAEGVGGRLFVDSAIGQGTTVRAELPLERP